MVHVVATARSKFSSLTALMNDGECIMCHSRAHEGVDTGGCASCRCRGRVPLAPFATTPALGCQRFATACIPTGGLAAAAAPPGLVAHGAYVCCWCRNERGARAHADCADCDASGACGSPRSDAHRPPSPPVVPIVPRRAQRMLQSHTMRDIQRIIVLRDAPLIPCAWSVCRCLL